ncbi:hypothetical protein D9757_002794 [Collybiopsis confluens]|uniref:Uncharacterized protein n=1 Tax=Collybiopsis confluens TaxID=2823264 RepID=A0A8H5MDT8_9AGAR|nr:hypothetical protein D9757_002794 [Collybiopsis confluens]
MLLVRAHQHLLLLLITLVSLALRVEAGQGFTNGLAIIDAPNPGSPGHAGSALSIAIDVIRLTSSTRAHDPDFEYCLQISGNGQLAIGSDASNPASMAATHFSLLEIYLVSAETSLNVTVSNGSTLLTQEPGSSVKHLNWPVPNCIPAGNYNLTFYETSSIQGQPHFIITPIPVPIQNPNPSKNPCSQTAGIAVNSLQGQPQAQNPLSQPVSPGGGQMSSTSSGPAFITITLSGPLPFPVQPTVTVTPSASPTTVFIVSMTTETVTTTGPSGFITKTITTAAWSSTVAVTQNAEGFLPVNAGSRPLRVGVASLFSIWFSVVLWTLLV